MLRAARRRLPTGNLVCTGGAGPPCLLWVLPAAAVTVCMAEVTGATALIPLSLGGSPGYGLSREFWKGPSMQTRSHSGYWLPLQIPGIGDETVRHLQFQNGANSALLGRGGLNTSRLPGLPVSMQSQPSPTQLTYLLPEAGKWQIFTIFQAQTAGCLLVLSGKSCFHSGPRFPYV